MITCEEIYDLHITGALESALCEAYREIPLDSRNMQVIYFFTSYHCQLY